MCVIAREAYEFEGFGVVPVRCNFKMNRHYWEMKIAKESDIVSLNGLHS